MTLKSIVMLGRILFTFGSNHYMYWRFGRVCLKPAVCVMPLKKFRNLNDFGDWDDNYTLMPSVLALQWSWQTRSFAMEFLEGGPMWTTEGLWQDWKITTFGKQVFPIGRLLEGIKVQ